MQKTNTQNQTIECRSLFKYSCTNKEEFNIISSLIEIYKVSDPILCNLHKDNPEVFYTFVINNVGTVHACALPSGCSEEATTVSFKEFVSKMGELITVFTDNRGYIVSFDDENIYVNGHCIGFDVLVNILTQKGYDVK